MNFYCRKYAFVFFGIGALLLSGCLSNPKHDLEKWLQEEDKKFSVNDFKKLDDTQIVPKKFEPVSVDPFQSIRIGVSLDQLKSRPDYTQDPSAPPLKDVSLQDLKLVGLIVNKNLRMALVQYGPDLFRVGIGAKIGLNDGNVIDINSSGVRIKQHVDDGTGKIVDRITVMHF